MSRRLYLHFAIVSRPIATNTLFRQGQFSSTSLSMKNKLHEMKLTMTVTITAECMLNMYFISWHDCPVHSRYMNYVYSNVCSVQAVTASGHDIWRHTRQPSHIVVCLPCPVGRRLRWPTCPCLPSQSPRMVRAIQVRVRMASDWPWRPLQGQPFRTYLLTGILRFSISGCSF